MVSLIKKVKNSMQTVEFFSKIHKNIVIVFWK